MSESNISFSTRLSAWMQGSQEKFFNTITNYLDKGYKFIRIKPIRTPEQQKFIESYEKMFLLQSSGLFFMCISGIYFSKFAYKSKSLSQKELKNLFLKAGLLSAAGTALTFNAYSINSKEKVLEKAEAYGKRFEALAEALKP